MKELDEIRKEIKDVSVKIADVQREQCRIERMFTKASEQKPAHKWEAGQWAFDKDNNVAFQISAINSDTLWKDNIIAHHISCCVPIPAPAFEIGQTVAKKSNGDVLSIIARVFNNNIKRWSFKLSNSDDYDESELTAKLPKFKVGDPVVHTYCGSYTIKHEIIWVEEMNTWSYDGNYEYNLTLAPSSGWKVGDMAVMIYVSGIKTIFEVKKIVPNEHLLVSKDGCMYRFEDCRHLVSMQVEGEKREEIKPGRWVRTPSGWEGLTVRQFNDGDWHVIEPAHGGGGLFKSSSLILINRPPEVLR